MCLLRPPCGSATREVNQVEVCRGLLPTPGLLVLEPLERVSHIAYGQLLPVTSPGPPGRSYKAISGWSLLVLDMEACRRDYTVKLGQTLLVPGLGCSEKVPWYPKD